MCSAVVFVRRLLLYLRHPPRVLCWAGGDRMTLVAEVLGYSGSFRIQAVSAVRHTEYAESTTNL